MPTDLRGMPRRSVLSALTFAGVGVATSGTLLSTAGPAHAASSVGCNITRSEMIERAKRWVDLRVPYSQAQADAYPDGDGHRYRPDCSGYVSMAWHLPKKPDGWDFNTGDFASYSGKTYLSSHDQLKAGDALLSAGHIVLFHSGQTPPGPECGSTRSRPGDASRSTSR